MTVVKLPVPRTDGFISMSGFPQQTSIISKILSELLGSGSLSSFLLESCRSRWAIVRFINWCAAFIHLANTFVAWLLFGWHTPLPFCACSGTAPVLTCSGGARWAEFVTRPGSPRLWRGIWTCCRNFGGRRDRQLARWSHLSASCSGSSGSCQGQWCGITGIERDYCWRFHRIYLNLGSGGGVRGKWVPVQTWAVGRTPRDRTERACSFNNLWFLAPSCCYLTVLAWNLRQFREPLHFLCHLHYQYYWP